MGLLYSINKFQRLLSDSVFLFYFLSFFFFSVTVSLLSVMYQVSAFLYVSDTILSTCSPVFLLSISLKKTIIFSNQHFNNCWACFMCVCFVLYCCCCFFVFCLFACFPMHLYIFLKSQKKKLKKISSIGLFIPYG